MARRNRGQGSQGNAQGRAQGRVRGRVQQRARGSAQRGGTDRTGAAGRKRSTLDLGAIEGYAKRLAEQSRSSRGTSGPELAGAASALAGGSFASRFMESGTHSSEEDFRKEVADQFAVIEERLQRLEAQVQGAGELEGTGDPAKPEGETSPDVGR